ncbi:MAG: hypothetical protein QXG68_07915 [Candidatus Bathyarchaeia archaeon]
MQICQKLKNLRASQIASFLMREFNQNKVKYIIEEFKELGFTKESLVSDKNNLFQFLVLVSFDRRPFSPYEIVWNLDNPQSVFSVLKRNGLLELSRMDVLSEDELDRTLEKLTVKNLHLNYLDLAKRIRTAKTMKQLASNIDGIFSILRNLKSGLDVIKLHRMIDKVNGIGSTIAAKFIMYTVRCMGIGNINPSEYSILAEYLKSEWRNSKWVRQLKMAGILKEVEEELKDDLFAFDYFWDLDRYYCSLKKCNECGL